MNVGGFHDLKRLCVPVCAAMACAGTAFGSVDANRAEANPYLIISQRNVFHLIPPPPPPVVADKAPDLPKVMLTGFVETGHVMRVLLAKLPVKDTTNTTTYLSLKTGERKDDVEVVLIRAEKEEVDIINSGTPMTLCAASNSFTKSGIASKGAAVAGATTVIAQRPAASRAAPMTGGGMAGASAAPAYGSLDSAASGSSAIVMGGGGWGAPSGSGAGSANPGSPNAGLPGSKMGTSGTGATGGTPANAAGFNGGGSDGETVSSPSGSSGLSEALQKKYQAALAAGQYQAAKTASQPPVAP